MIKNFNFNNSIVLNDINRDFTKPRLNEKLNPFWVTGFIDGEGCFRISLTKVNRAVD